MNQPTDTIIQCTSCDRQLRIPNDRGKLRVTCPTCRTSWVWLPPALPSEEYRQVPFRCAQTGARFHVIFKRQVAFQRFRISRISMASECGRSTAPGDVSVASFSANDFDFSGWECPSCGYARDGQVNLQFVQCAKCGECVCGRRTQQIDGGGITFMCHDGCGDSGRVEGQITSYCGMPTEPNEAHGHRLPSQHSHGVEHHTGTKLPSEKS
jgi:hypothetical protein